MDKINHKLKIDVINRYFLPVAAGIETCLMETYPRLKKKGWDVTIHTSQSTLTQKNCLPKNDTVENIPILRYPLGKFGFFPKIDWANTDIVSLNNFDVFPHFQVLVYCLFLKLLGKKKFALILAPHGGFTPEWSIFSKIQSFIKKTYHYTLGTILINLVVDKVQAVSNWERNEIISKGVTPELVTTIENGIEKDAFTNIEKKASLAVKKQVKKFGKYIVQIGRIHPIKNYETTILSLTKLPKDINFVIIGPDQDLTYRKYLENLIQKLKLSKRVLFTGVVRGVDKFYVLKKAQMMVHMAIWESFSNVIYEGFTQGLVCIAANNTALSYLIKNGVNGYLVETKDSDALSEKIIYFLKNKQKKNGKEISQRNKKNSEQYSWKSVSENISKLFLQFVRANKNENI